MSGPFKMRGWSPFTQKPGTKKDIEKINKKTEKEHDVSAHVTEGSAESQTLILKTRCEKKGGTWNNETHVCEYK